MMVDQVDIVIYHQFCQDGFASAHVVHDYALKNWQKEPEYRPASYGMWEDAREELIAKCKGMSVLMVDFTFDKPILDRIKENAKQLVILDHHLTAREKIGDYEGYTYSETMSGVGMTWKYFHPDAKLPLIYACIQDRDLWKFELPDTEEVYYYLSSIKMTMEAWDKMTEFTVIASGRAMKMMADAMIENEAKNCYVKTLGFNGKTLKVGYCQSNVFRSEIGNRIAKRSDVDIAVVFSYDGKKDRTCFSFRGLDEKQSGAEIALAYGGGGHRNAAACYVSGNHVRLPALPVAEPSTV